MEAPRFIVQDCPEDGHPLQPINSGWSDEWICDQCETVYLDKPAGYYE